MSSLQARIESIRADLANAESSRDLLEHDLLRAETDIRIDSAGLRLIRDQVSSWEVDVAELSLQLNTLQREAKELEGPWNAGWGDLRSRSEHYFNECLALDFEAPWSISNNSCMWLRHCLDEQEIIARCRKRITLLWGDLLRAKNRLAKSPYQDEKDEYKREAGEIESEIQKEEKQLARRKEQYCQDRNEICTDVIRPILENSGRIEREPSHHAAHSSERGINGHPNADKTALPDDIEREEEAPLQDDPLSEDTPEGESRGSRSPTLSLDELRRLFVVQQDVVQNLRQGYDDEIDKLRFSEGDHLLTFTDSTHARYERLIAKQMESSEEEIGIEEGKLAKLYRQIVEAGGEVPRSRSSHSSQSVRGEGTRQASRRSETNRCRRSTPPERRYSNKQGRIGRWRLNADKVRRGVNKPLTEHSPGKSLASSQGLRSRSHTRSRSPDPEWDEYLDRHREQYRKQQEKSRGKHKNQTAGSGSDYESRGR